jgi:hypothetical protein
VKGHCGWLRLCPGDQDISCGKLFQQPGEGTEFTMSVAVRAWHDDLNPEWEFRLFIVETQPTAMSIYSEFTYDPRIVEHKARIEELIMECWAKASPRVGLAHRDITLTTEPPGSFQFRDRIHGHSTTYTIDFSVAPDLTNCYVIEVEWLPVRKIPRTRLTIHLLLFFLIKVNNFSAPLAGSALFDYSNPQDRELLKKGPYSFRINEQPRKAMDRVKILEDGEKLGCRTQARH